MKHTIENKTTDIEECRNKLFNLLREYNCQLISADEWQHVLLLDKDTNETVSVSRE